MRKVVFLILSLIWAGMIYGQNYYPLIEEDKTWNVLAVAFYSPFDTSLSTITYKLLGDTVINSITYKKAYISNEENPVNWNFGFGMREDENQKVWLKDNMEEEEYLLYDFSIAEGDSILVGYPEPIYLYVDSITLLTVNETLRQKYWLSCKIMPEYRETWIEGIGSNRGIVYSGSAFIVGGWYWLLCTSIDEELIYMNPDFNDCYLSSAPSQCFAEAGSDVIVCCGFNGMDTVQLGGNPTAYGGTPPYSYIWETSWTVGSWTYTASDFLDDTTLANPRIIYTGEDLTFHLTVTDIESNVCTDSVHVGFTNFGTHLGYVTYNIQQGDSIYLSNWENVFGGFPPYRYLWRPNHGITDSTSLSFWAKPDSSVAYYLSLTDSSGCTAVGAPVYYVNVIPLSIDQPNRDQMEVVAFPNPANEQISISVEGDTSETLLFEIFDSRGRLIYNEKTQKKNISLKTKSLNKGMNFYKISNTKKTVGQGKFVID